MMLSPDLPVAVIGAGPVGLAAAAHLVQRGIRPLVFERGDERRRIAARMGACAGLLALALQHRCGRARLARGVGLAGARRRTALPTGGEIVARLSAAARGAAGDRRQPEARRDGHRHHARGPRQGLVARPRRLAPSSSATAIATARSIACAPGPSSTRPEPGRSPTRSASTALACPAKARRPTFIAYGIPDVRRARARSTMPASACWSSAAAIPRSTSRWP